MTITADDLNYCRALAAHEQYPLYLISLFTPATTRHAWWALMAFQAELAKICHTVSNPLAGQIRLQWWRDALAQITANTPPAHPVARALAAIIQQFNLPIAPFEILIEAREDDLGTAPGDANCLANYGRATTVPLLQLMLACEGRDAASQGQWFPWLDAIGTQWGQLQALKIWPQFSNVIHAAGGDLKTAFGSPALRIEDDKPYLSLLNILLKAERQKLNHAGNNPGHLYPGYGIGTLLKLWWHSQQISAPQPA